MSTCMHKWQYHFIITDMKEITAFVRLIHQSGCLETLIMLGGDDYSY